MIKWKLPIRKRMKVNLYLAVAALGIAFFVPFLVNNLFVYPRPTTDSPGQWLERSGAINTVFSLLVISLMDECLATIRARISSPRLKKFKLYKSYEKWAIWIRNSAFLISLMGIIVWGYGSLIYVYFGGA